MGSLEQRRSKRYPTQLPVDLLMESAPRRMEAVNVSRHGMFVATSDPPPVRFVVQIMLHLPDGPLAATGFVARQATRGTSGVGLQFFTMSASNKRRWDYYVYWLANRSPFSSADGPTPLSKAQEEERATFLVKLDSDDAVRKVYTHNFPIGTIYLATPLLHRPGELVNVILIHHETEVEFILQGSICRVRNENPRGVEIRLDPMSDAQRRNFSVFVNEPEDTIPKIRPPLPQIREDSDLMIDIHVGDPLDNTGEFSWDQVSEDLVIDMELTAEEGTSDLMPEDPTADPRDSWGVPRNRFEPVPEPDTGDLAVTVDLPGEPITARVECKGCGEIAAEILLGEPDGPIGMLASYRLYWSPESKKVVSVLRLKPLIQRQEALDEVGGLEGEMVKQEVPLFVVFQVADLAEAPRCPETNGALWRNEAIQKLEDATQKLVTEDKAFVEGAPCPRCGHHEWYTTGG